MKNIKPYFLALIIAGFSPAVVNTALVTSGITALHVLSSSTEAEAGRRKDKRKERKDLREAQKEERKKMRAKQKMDRIAIRNGLVIGIVEPLPKNYPSPFIPND